MAKADFRLLIVWTNTFLTDGEAGARTATALFDDPRVEQFHDPERHVGRALADLVGMPSLAEVAAAKGQRPEDLAGRFRDGYLYGEASVFDTMLFFPPGAEWTDEPPEPAGWVTQLDPALFLIDAARFRFGEEMGDEMARLANVLLAKEEADGPRALPGRVVWDAPAHETSGDVVRFRGRFVAAHRAAESPSAAGGRVRVIASEDGERWDEVALLAEPGIDLRDPRLTVAPDGRLLLTAGGARFDGAELVERRTLVSASADGTAFGALEPARGLPAGSGSLRLAWHAGTGWCLPDVGGADPATRRVALYRTRDGLEYEPVLERLELAAGACEASPAFEPDGTLLAVLRDALDARRAWLVRSEAPYREVEAVEVAHGLSGAHLVRLEDGRLLVGAREGPGDDDPVILALERDGSFRRLARLAGKGGAGSPALVVHADELWIQYSSSHAGGSAIYVARAPLDALD